MSNAIDSGQHVDHTRQSLELLDITEYWSFWQKALPRRVPRTLPLPETLSDSLVLVVQGVRRCGKSTLLTQLLERYRLPKKNCAFLNFEDPRLGFDLDHRLLTRWVQEFRAARRGSDKLYFFLDEVQGVKGWQKWLLTHLERPEGNHFVVTGSNARLLSGEYSTLLTGRHHTAELFPFDFAEFLLAKPGAQFADYLHEGGFPEPLLATDGERLRLQYFHDIVERDIRERVGSRSSAPVRQLMQMAFEATGSETSLRRLAGVSGIAVDTVATYLEAAEAAYLLLPCPFFSYSERKRAMHQKKYYPIDPGLRRQIVTQGGKDRGKALETAVFLALRRQGLRPCYWRGRGEVDFVVQAQGKTVPVQVSWDDPEERHERALLEFYEHFPHAGEAKQVSAAGFAADDLQF